MNTIITKDPFFLARKRAATNIYNAKIDSNAFHQRGKREEDSILLNTYPKWLSLFERSCIVFPQILSFLDQGFKNDIVLKEIKDLTNFLSLKNIFVLRLLSKTIYQLVSIHHFLKEKAFINFNYSELRPKNPLIQEKLSFCEQEDTEIRIISSMNDLLSLPSMLQSYKENRPKICLRIQDLGELSRLNALLSNKIKLNFADLIVKLDLTKIPINSRSINEINVLLEPNAYKFFECLPSARSLAFGSVWEHFTAPDFNIKSLSFESVGRSGTLEIKYHYCTLKELFIGKVDGNVKISNGAHCLNHLSIGSIGSSRESSLELFSSSPIESFSIGDIVGKYNLSIELPNLISLYIGDLFGPEQDFLWMMRAFSPAKAYDEYFQITALVPNLINLTIGNIYNNIRDSDRNFLDRQSLDITSSMTNLRSLKIGNIQEKCKIKFPKFPNLVHLNIGNISAGAAIEFIGALDNLEDFSLGDVSANVILKLPAVLPKVKYSIVGTIEDQDTFLTIAKTLNSKTP